MLISRKNKFIFIHIYKNAGTSITKALQPFTVSKLQYITELSLKRVGLITSLSWQPYAGHISASNIIKQIGKEEFEEYFSFAIVRNPWDWQVSLYKYMLKNKKHHQHQYILSLKDFDEYIKWRCKNEIRLQKKFICDRHDNILVDFVGRFENLENDFQYICSSIGVSTRLPKLNVSNKKNYRKFYTKELKELVRVAFQADIDYFGYDF
jgi:hypothetical protein